MKQVFLKKTKAKNTVSNFGPEGGGRRASGLVRIASICVVWVTALAAADRPIARNACCKDTTAVSMSPVKMRSFADVWKLCLLITLYQMGNQLTVIQFQCSKPEASPCHVTTTCLLHGLTKLKGGSVEALGGKIGKLSNKCSTFLKPLWVNNDTKTLCNPAKHTHYSSRKMKQIPLRHSVHIVQVPPRTTFYRETSPCGDTFLL